MNTHDAFVQFGKHKGERLTRVPANYLRWALSTECDAAIYLPGEARNVAFHEAAQSEILRRGERLGEVELSAHAVDRFSTKYLEDYLTGRLPKTESGEPEGLYSYIERVATQVVNFAGADFMPEEPRDGEKKSLDYSGITWVFQVDTTVPVLITVKPVKGAPRPAQAVATLGPVEEPMEEALPWE